MSICVSDIPKERILKHPNGKMYLNLTTYDYAEPDQFNNDFSVSLPLTSDQKEAKNKGETIQRTFLGNGRIWPDTEMQSISEKDEDDLPF